MTELMLEGGAGTKEATGALQTLFRARYPVLAVVTSEEGRVEKSITGIGAAASPPMDVIYWSVTKSFRDGPDEDKKAKVLAEGMDPPKAIRWIMDYNGRAIFILRDFHHYVGHPTVMRLVRDMSHALRLTKGDQAKSVVFLSPEFNLPRDLEKEVQLVDWPLPSRGDIEEVIARAVRSLDAQVREKIQKDLQDKEHLAAVVDSCLGLNEDEIGSVLARSVVQRRALDRVIIAGEKRQVVEKAGVIKWRGAASTDNLGLLGGFEGLKNYLRVRRRGFSPEARAAGLDAPRGIGIGGYPGTGKSLCAKLVAAEWGLPLLELDPGAVFGRYVGDSEANIRRALETAELVAPCVLQIDEMDKGGLAGMQGGGMDGHGTTQRVYGTLLKWLQERRGRAPVFVIFTFNNMNALDSALTRKGRVDQFFWVDLPRPSEREAILRIHLAKRGRDVKKLKLDLRRVAALANNLVGSELEAIVVESLYRAFNEDRDVTTEDLVDEVKSTTPMYSAREAEMKAYAAAAKGRCVQAAAADVVEIESAGASRTSGLEIGGDALN